MRSFGDYRRGLKEERDGVVLVWGRFNPPTRGHEHVFNKAAQIANENRYQLVVMASHSLDEKTNPIPYSDKIQYMRELFPRYRGAIRESQARDAVQALVELNETYKKAIVVCGDDRLETYENLFDRGNGDYFNYDLLEARSVGKRDPKSEGIRGISSSSARLAVVNNNFPLFESSMPRGIDETVSRNLYQALRDGLGVKNVVFERSETREKFYSGELCEVGDIVEMKDGMQGPVVVKGANYVIIESNGKRHRYWATDIKE